MTEDDVRQMLRERCEASSQASVAREAGVSRQIVGMMLGGHPVCGRARDLLGVERKPMGRPLAYRAQSDWRPLLVINKYGFGYPDDFDRNKVYEFRREGSDKIETFKLDGCDSYFNVAGLMWRDP